MKAKNNTVPQRSVTMRNGIQIQYDQGTKPGTETKMFREVENYLRGLSRQNDVRDVRPAVRLILEKYSGELGVYQIGCGGSHVWIHLGSVKESEAPKADRVCIITEA